LDSIAGMNTGSTIIYKYDDTQPGKDEVFYRIKAIDKDGSVKYTNIVRLNIAGRNNDAIAIYPNPIVTDNFKLLMSKLEKGRYFLQIYDNNGQLLLNKTIDHWGGSAPQVIYLPAATAAGVYQLLLSNDKIKISYTIIVAR